MFEKYALSLQQVLCPHTLPLIISRNRVLTLCNYGGGRSPEAAWKLTEEFGINSVYFDCGLGGLSMLNPTLQKTITANLKRFPHIIAFLYELERRTFRYSINSLDIPDNHIFPSVEPFITQVRSKQIKFSCHF